MPVDAHGREPDDPHYGEPASGGDGATPPAGKKKGDKKTGVLIILTAAGVLIGWLTLRSRGNAQSAASSANNPNYLPQQSPGSGMIPGYSPDAGAGFESMIANLQAEVAQLITAQTTPITAQLPPTSTGPAAVIPGGGMYQAFTPSGAPAPALYTNPRPVVTQPSYTQAPYAGHPALN